MHHCASPICNLPSLPLGWTMMTEEWFKVEELQPITSAWQEKRRATPFLGGPKTGLGSLLQYVCYALGKRENDFILILLLPPTHRCGFQSECFADGKVEVGGGEKESKRTLKTTRALRLPVFFSFSFAGPRMDGVTWESWQIKNSLQMCSWKKEKTTYT